MAKIVREMVAESLQVFLKGDRKVNEDDVVDSMERTLRKSHIARINERVCLPPSGVIYLDVISNLERIADHATNFAQVILGEV